MRVRHATMTTHVRVVGEALFAHSAGELERADVIVVTTSDVTSSEAHRFRAVKDGVDCLDGIFFSDVFLSVLSRCLCV